MVIKHKSQWSVILIVSTFFWATFYLFLKIIDQRLSPLLLAWARHIFASLFLLGLMVWRRQLKLPSMKEAFRLLILGILGLAVPTILLVIGIRYSSSVVGSILINSSTLLIAIFAPLLLPEKSNRKQYTGIVIGLIGVALVIVNGQNIFSSFDNKYLLGSIMVLGAAIGVALFSIYAKNLIEKYGGLFVVFYCMVGASLVLTIANLLGNNFKQLINLPLSQYLYLMAIGVISTAIPYLVWFSALKYIKVTTAASYRLLIPIVTTFYAIVLFEEKITTWIIIGMIFTLIGVAIVNYHYQPQKYHNYHCKHI